MTNTDEFAHAQARLRGFEVIHQPFEHYMVRDFFRPEFYPSVIANLPDDSSYNWGVSADAHEKSRGTLVLNRATIARFTPKSQAFWRELAAWIGSLDFVSDAASKFRSEIVQRLQAEPADAKLLIEIKLVRDRKNYALRPHTDAANRVTTLMVYLAKDQRVRNFGTSIYVPKDSALRDFAGDRRHDYADFEEVARAPFLPNSGLGFLKSDKSFHGVELFDGEGLTRDFLTFSIRCVSENPRQTFRRIVSRMVSAEANSAMRVQHLLERLC